MHRRNLLAGLAGAALSVGPESASGQEQMNTTGNSYLELTTWYLHNSAEDQAHRVTAFLRDGLLPVLGDHFVSAFSNVMGPGGPYYMTLTQFASLAQMQESVEARRKNSTYTAAVSKMSGGTGAPFVRVESSILRCFDFLPKLPTPAFPPTQKIFELRTYESPSLEALERKVGMFNAGEAAIFTRLGFHPVFFAETIVGVRQPNLSYMLSYESLADHDRLWGAFGKDPEWQALRSKPGLSDAEVVSNINNVLLAPMKL